MSFIYGLFLRFHTLLLMIQVVCLDTAHAVIGDLVFGRHRWEKRQIQLRSARLPVRSVALWSRNFSAISLKAAAGLKC
jgi:hypothetical protein